MSMSVAYLVICYRPEYYCCLAVYGPRFGESHPVATAREHKIIGFDMVIRPVFKSVDTGNLKAIEVLTS